MHMTSIIPKTQAAHQKEHQITCRPNQARRTRIISPKDFLQPCKAPEWLEAEVNMDLSCCRYPITAGEKYKLLAIYLSPKETSQTSVVYLQDSCHHLLTVPLSKICSCFLRAAPPGSNLTTQI